MANPGQVIEGSYHFAGFKATMETQLAAKQPKVGMYLLLWHSWASA